MTYERYGAGLNNTISAQIIYVDYSLDLENLYSDIYYSDWKNLSAVFYETLGNGTSPNDLETNVSKTADDGIINLISITGNAILGIDSWLNPVVEFKKFSIK